MTTKDSFERAENHLQKALAETDHTEKNYHIRAALQELSVQPEESTG